MSVEEKGRRWMGCDELESDDDEDEDECNREEEVRESL